MSPTAKLSGGTRRAGTSSPGSIVGCILQPTTLTRNTRPRVRTSTRTPNTPLSRAVSSYSM